MKKSKNFKEYFSFTIIEALIAVSILTVAFVGVIQIFPGVIGLNINSKNLTIASHLGEMKLEEYLAKPYEQIPLGTTPTSPEAFTDNGFENYKWQIEVSQESTDLKKIEVTVFWGNNNQYNTDLVTFQAK